MADRNGYFCIIPKGSETWVQLVAPEGSGSRVDLKEMEDYLTLHRIQHDRVPLLSAIGDKAEGLFRVNREKVYPVPESSVLRVSQDGMSVIVRFYPPTEGAGLVTADELKGDLKAAGIKAELDEKEAEAFFSDRHYCTDYVIARGTPPKEGTDGYVEYLFNTDPLARPKTNEDGSVDFHSLGLVHACAKGQVLARIHKEVPGEFGFNVYGDVVYPKEVKKVQVRCGKDITRSEDGTELISGLDGHVDLVGDTIFVSGVLEINDVDVSTGDLSFEGDVLVHGNVATGYKLKASGNIEIQGIVEAAEVEAGGRLTVVRGINGMGKGLVKAGGSVVTKYINSATVEAGELLQSELILNSSVSAKDTIVVKGKKGFISGGHIRAGNVVEAKIIGSDMGTDTVIEVGVDPEIKEKNARLHKEEEDLRGNLSRIEPVLLAMAQRLKKGEKLAPEQIQKMQELNGMVQKGKARLTELEEEKKELAQQIGGNSDAAIVVFGEALPGTKVIVSDAALTLKTGYHYCRFKKEHGDVKMFPI